MTKIEALNDLLFKVKNDGNPYNEISTISRHLAGDAIVRTHIEEQLIEASEGSLDAAMELHEAVLPGWPWSVKTLATDSVQVWTNYAYGLRTLGHIGTTKDNPARAWLIAILKALIEMEDTPND